MARHPHLLQHSFSTNSFPQPFRHQRRPRVQLPGRETLGVALLLAVAAAIRVALAAQGWSYVNSDEATLGLMAEDILWHGAHPIFLYGQDYLGALDAYLQTPFFLLFGPTNLALHLTTTVQILLFLLVLYRFTRAVYSPLVAWGTLLLLAVPSEQALFFMERAGAHAQDTLLLSALLLWLVLLRLRHQARGLLRLALNLGIGLVIGLGLWSTFLVIPFVVAAGVALGGAAFQRLRSRQTRPIALVGQGLTLAAAALLGMAPLIVGTIASGGIGWHEIMQAASGVSPGGSSTSPGVFWSWGQQVLTTLLFGLPSMFGRQTVCAGCLYWPAPQTNPPLGQVLLMTLIGAGFSLLLIGCWLLATLPLARDIWHGLRQALRGSAPQQTPGAEIGDARWWGRMMLVISFGLTVLEYLATRSAYTFPNTAIRYLSGIYLCTPLLADPLCRGASTLWRWISARQQSAGVVRPGLPAFLATTLLLALLVINLTGVINAFQSAADQQLFGVPAGIRDRQLIAFLTAHDATRFYTTYFVCDRLMFDAQEQVVCSVVQDDNAFAPVNNRIARDMQAVEATPDPAYVFDLTTSEVNPQVLHQLTHLLAVQSPPLVGYTSAQVDGYIIFYAADRT